MIKSLYDAIQRFPPLDKEEERDMFKKKEKMEELNRDDTDKYDEICDKIINHHIWLAHFMVDKYYSAQLNYSISDKTDLVQSALQGVIESALPRFDISKGYRFSTYARWWIRDSVNQTLQKMGSIKVPQQLKKIQAKLSRLEKRAQQAYDDLSEEEKARKIGENQDAVARAEKLPSVTYLSKKKFSEGEETLIQYLEDSDSLSFRAEMIQEELREIFDDIFDEVSDREEKVLKERFGWDNDERTLRDIGEELDLSRERIRQIESVALEKINADSSTILKDFVDREDLPK